MPLLPAPAQLSHPEKDALIAALTARLALADERIAAQDARIAALEARLNELTRPPKTPGNSSKPPSQGQKPDLPAPAHGSPAAQEPPRRRPDAASEPGSHDRSAADHLPEMRGGVSRTRRKPRSRSMSASSCRRSGPT